MTEAQTLVYVMASATALGVPLDTARAQRIASHLKRTAALAELLEQSALLPEHEPAEIYCPQPFPPAARSV